MFVKVKDVCLIFLKDFISMNLFICFLQKDSNQYSIE